MVIGNGFFSDTLSDAVKEMQRISQCEVVQCAFPTIGNIVYYISYNGDIFGMQTIGGKRLTRNRKTTKNKGGISARLSISAHREVCIPLQVLTYCSFVIKAWNPDVELTFVNGDVYDVRPCNLVEQKEPIPQEWTDRMCEQSTDYERNYKRICNAVSFFNGLSIEDSQDVVSQTFIYLCTEGFNESIKDHNDFIGLWLNLSQKRAIDFLRRRFILSDNLEKIIGCRQRTYEVNLFEVQPGARSQKYLKLWAQGYSTTEIAKECGVTLSTVSSSITRSIQFLQKYLKNDLTV